MKEFSPSPTANSIMLSAKLTMFSMAMNHYLVIGRWRSQGSTISHPWHAPNLSPSPKRIPPRNSKIPSNLSLWYKFLNYISPLGIQGWLVQIWVIRGSGKVLPMASDPLSPIPSHSRWRLTHQVHPQEVVQLMIRILTMHSFIECLHSFAMLFLEVFYIFSWSQWVCNGN